MILGINFKNENQNEDLIKIIEITQLDKNWHTVHYIQEYMKNYDKCIIVLKRDSFFYKEGDIVKYSHLMSATNDKFIHYEKANHTINLFNNFIYEAGVMHGKAIVIKRVIERLEEMDKL